MAFQFPDPAVTTTVVNPETGITYQWKADPGKWVITTGEPEDDCLSTILTFIDGYIDYRILSTIVLTRWLLWSVVLSVLM